MSKYVEREILNHKRLIHPHIVQLKEVSHFFALTCLFQPQNMSVHSRL